MMTRLDQIARQLEARWSNDPAYPSCMKILKFIAQNEPQKSAMLTYQDVAQIVGDPRFSDETERALTLLTSRFRVLALHFVFIDDEGERHYLDDDEASAFVQEGTYADPESGREIADPAAHLFPYYQARADELLQEVGT